MHLSHVPSIFTIHCNNLSRRYDITTLKHNISILSESSINLIMKMMVNFSQYTFTKQFTNTWINTCVYILNHCTSFTCQNIIQFLHVSKPGLYMPNQKNQGINLWRVNKKTQLYPKINSNIITSAWQLQQKTFFQRHLLLLICSHELRFTIITGTNHTVQNCKGRFIIKDKQKLDDNY